MTSAFQVPPIDDVRYLSPIKLRLTDRAMSVMSALHPFVASVILRRVMPLKREEYMMAAHHYATQALVYRAKIAFAANHAARKAFGRPWCSLDYTHPVFLNAAFHADDKAVLCDLNRFQKACVILATVHYLAAGNHSNSAEMFLRERGL